MKIVEGRLPRGYSRYDGFKICCPDTLMGRKVAQAGAWQGHVTRALLEHLTPDTTFLDVGAGIGYYTLIAAAVGCRAVYAFDPHPAHLDTIRQSVALNGYEQVRIIAAGASDVTGTATLWMNPGNDGDSRMDSHSSDRWTGITIATVRLNDAVSDGPPMVIKLDIQGHEPRALAGADRILREVRPVVVAEESSGHLQLAGFAPDSVRTLLRSYGYTAERITVGGKESGDVLAVPWTDKRTNERSQK